MDRGEIWLVSLDPIAGHEQSGKRPVLIVSKASFNKLTRLPVVVPVTSGGNFARTAGFTVSLEEAGTKTTGVIRCDQPRTIDMAARNAYQTPLSMKCLPGWMRFSVNVSDAKKQKACSKAGFLNLAPLTGLEPVTYGLTVRRSTD